MNNQTFAIGVLSTTAAILLVGLLVIGTRPQPAVAFGMNADAGDHYLLTGQFGSSEELLYVISPIERRMIAYRYDTNQNKIVVVTSVEFDQVFPGAQGQPPQQQQRGRGSRRYP
jgi:hypothetical protein